MEVFNFFLANAGYSYDPKTETPNAGRQRAARALSAGEAFANEIGIDFAWSVDPDIDSSDFDDSENPWQLWCVDAWHNGEHVGSLGGVDFGCNGSPYGSDYARVVCAEIAREYQLTREELENDQREELEELLSLNVPYARLRHSHNVRNYGAHPSAEHIGGVLRDDSRRIRRELSTDIGRIRALRFILKV